MEMSIRCELVVAPAGGASDARVRCSAGGDSGTTKLSSLTFSPWRRVSADDDVIDTRLSLTTCLDTVLDAERSFDDVDADV